MVKGVKKVKGGQFHLSNNYRDHPILLRAATSVSKVKEVKVGQLYLF